MRPIYLLLFLLLGITQTQAQQTSHHYDPLNRLTQVEYGNGTVIEYCYDEVGNMTCYNIAGTSVQPDLGIRTISLSTSTVGAGASVVVTATDTNYMAGNAAGHYLRFYLSEDVNYQPNTDTTLATQFISGLSGTSAVEVQKNITIPASTASGAWHFIVCTDANGNLVAETDENNNCLNVPITITNCGNVTLSFTQTNESCYQQNGMATVSATGGMGPFTYNWGTFPLQAGPSISGLSAGTYNVTATDANGCETAGSISLSNNGDAPSSGFAFSTDILEVTFTNTSLDGATFLWHFGDGDSSLVENPVHTYDLPGTYTVCVSVSNTCGNGSYCEDIFVNAAFSGVGTGGAQTNSQPFSKTLLDTATNDINQVIDVHQRLDGKIYALLWAKNYEYVIQAYDTTGNVLFSKEIENLEGSPKGLDVTDDGNIILFGSTDEYGNGGADFFAAYLSPIGDVLWTKAFGGTWNDFLQNGFFDNDGNIVLVGYSNLNADWKSNVIKINPASGQITWMKTIDDPNSNYDFIRNGKLLHNGDYLLIGEFSNGATVVRMNKNGAILWAKEYPEDNTSWPPKYDPDFFDIYETPSGDVYLCGGHGIFQFDNRFNVTRIGSDGNLFWSKDFDDDGDNCDGFAIGEKGSQLVCTFINTVGDDIGIAVLDLAGNIVEAKKYSTGQNYELKASDVRGNAVLAGSIDYFSYRDAFLFVLDEDHDFPCNQVAASLNATNITLVPANATISSQNESFGVVSLGLGAINKYYQIEDPCAPSCNLAVTSTQSGEDCGQGDGFIHIAFTGNSGAVNIDWNTGYAGQNYNNLSAGSYTATVTDQLGCEVVQSFIIENSGGMPMSAFSASINGNNVTFTNNSTGANSYTWDFDDGTTSSVFEPAHVYYSNGTYQICLEVVNECGSNSTCQNIVVDCFQTSYQDADGDGYGNPTDSVFACGVPSGYVGNDTDCDDTNEDVYPGALELCDGIDNDCDNQVDENLNCCIVVTNTNDSGAGSLREAINCSNTFSGPDTITFNIPGAGPHVIHLLTELAWLTDAGTHIDATTQPNYQLGAIEIDGANITNGNILSLKGGNHVIKGLHLSNLSSGLANTVVVSSSNNLIIQNQITNARVAINATGSSTDNNVVRENIIGTDQYLSSGMGVSLTGIFYGLGADNNLTENNIIAYCYREAIMINQNAHENKVTKNQMICNGGPFNNHMIRLINGNQDHAAPVIGSATTYSISGTSTPLDSIELFVRIDSLCVSKPCQGGLYIGTTVANLSGDWSISGSSIQVPLEAGWDIVGTATDINGNTSQFSSCQTVKECTEVVSVLANGTGSLREAVACASSGDTILFMPSVFNQTIELDAPSIVVDKELYWQANLTDNITISNLDPANNTVLVEVQDGLYISGLKLIGKNPDSMIFKLESGGSLELISVEVDKLDVQKE